MDIETTLLRCRNLPSPSGVAMQVIELAQSPDADLSTTARIIGTDPALSARLLQVASSPLYANRRKVENLVQAMAMLGLNATVSLALGFSLALWLRNQSAHDAQERIWQHSVVAALAARLLGQMAGIKQAENLMLAGLLQDIGQLALLHAIPDEYAPLAIQATGNDMLLQLEREAFGADHAEIGALLARHWRLPEYLIEMIQSSESAPGDNPMQRCVLASSAVADLWLASEPVAEHLFQQASQRVQACLDEATPAALDQLLLQIAAALPDISLLFDAKIECPGHVLALSEQARELLMQRNLQQIQETNQANQEVQAVKERIQQLSERSRHDPLTGVFNRLQMEEALQREFSAAVSMRSPMTVALLDLDDFKQINDRHGHLIGDQVLRQFAQTLQRMLRSTDMVARYGGEEFMLLLNYSNEAAAAKVLQRILEEIATQPMAMVDGQPIRVTFSAGIATHDADTQPFDSPHALLKAADTALYAAKHGGRNQVRLHSA